MSSQSQQHYRPSTHFSPPHGFMNDPNGVIFNNNTYHLYYQYNPAATVAGNQHWGHATSPDLLHWQDHPIALKPHNGGLAFSGSVTVDLENRSQLFKGPSNENYVAVYTLHTDEAETQWVAISTDGGNTYTPKKEVLSVGSAHFRDPQVFYYPEEEKWVMVLALSRQHFVAFYESSNLLEWRRTGEFTGGIFGVDYECPNLVKVLDEVENRYRWVLFVSVNPGMPLGGSGTQYFVGDFDGRTFRPASSEVHMLDFGKDNYALQCIANDEATYIGWFGNWQYCQQTPTGNWRSTMTYARKITLGRDWLGSRKLVQRPVGIETLRNESLKSSLQIEAASDPESEAEATASLPANTALEISLNADFASQSVLLIELTNANQEMLVIGVDAITGQLFVDRSKLNGFKNPYFNGQFSAAIKQPVSHFEAKLLLDGCTLEVYAEDYITIGSFLCFPTSQFTSVRLAGAANASLTVCPLKTSVSR